MAAQVREHLEGLDERIARCDREIALACRADPAARRLQDVTGFGPTSADALVATIGNASVFRIGRQFAAWLGLTPKQFSSGGKARLGGITRRGDAYLRTLLVQGARSTLQQALCRSPGEANRLQQWIVQLHARAGHHKTLIAIANRNARMPWALLAREETYTPMRGRASSPRPAEFHVPLQLR